MTSAPPAPLTVDRSHFIVVPLRRRQGRLLTSLDAAAVLQAVAEGRSFPHQAGALAERSRLLAAQEQALAEWEVEMGDHLFDRSEGDAIPASAPRQLMFHAMTIGAFEAAAKIKIAA